MIVNPQEYDRNERRASSWWSSRHPEKTVGDAALRHSRRITLIDLLFLIIIMGVLLPFVFQMRKHRALGPYQMSFDERKRDGISTFIVSVSLPENAGEFEDIGQVGITVFDRSGRIIHESRDLPPGEGRSREFLFRDTEGLADSLEVFAGADSIVLELTEDGA